MTIQNQNALWQCAFTLVILLNFTPQTAATHSKCAALPVNNTAPTITCYSSWQFVGAKSTCLRQFKSGISNFCLLVKDVDHEQEELMPAASWPYLQMLVDGTMVLDTVGGAFILHNCTMANTTVCHKVNATNKIEKSTHLYFVCCCGVDECNEPAKISITDLCIEQNVCPAPTTPSPPTTPSTTVAGKQTEWLFIVIGVGGTLAVVAIVAAITLIVCGQRQRKKKERQSNSESEKEGKRNDNSISDKNRSTRG